MSTKLSKNDVRFIQSQAHATITIKSGSSDALVTPFLSGSNNILSPTTSSTYYTSLDHLFYKRHSNNTSGIYSHELEYLTNPTHKNKFYDNGVVITISADRYGQYIKPGTFSYWDNGDSSPMVIRDDGYGNIYPTNETGNLILSQSADSSISSSENYIGNIFYEHGIAVITETGSYKSGKKYTDFGTNYYMSFDSTVEINTMEYFCRLLPNEYNWSTNPTILEGDECIVTHSWWHTNKSDMHDQLNRKGYLYGYQGNSGWTKLIHEESGSTWRVNTGVIDPKYRTRTFQPYITKLALKNKDGENVMITTFEHPIQKRRDEIMTIKVQMDF